jgi:hypothetical protein
MASSRMVLDGIFFVLKINDCLYRTDTQWYHRTERIKCTYASSKYDLLLTVLIATNSWTRSSVLRSRCRLTHPPNARFPATNNAHKRSLEAGKFLDFPYQLRRPPAEYLIDDDEEEEGEEESGEALEPKFEMLHLMTWVLAVLLTLESCAHQDPSPPQQPSYSRVG